MSWPLPGAMLLGRFYSERNREYPLDRAWTTLGRACENTIVIRDEQIAPHHACVWRDGEDYAVEALSVEAATFVNGNALRPGGRRRLSENDLVRLASLEFEFRLEREPDAEVPRLWVRGGVHGGKVFRVPGAQALVGRALAADVQFPDRTVSRRHCALTRVGSGWRVEDLGSTNGTWVNGRPIVSAADLHDGDEVTIGFSRFVFYEGWIVPGLVRIRQGTYAG